MKKTTILMLFLFIANLAFTQVTKNDTIFYKTQIPFVKQDTIKFNLLKNDKNVEKITAYHINCVRYVAGTTWRTIKNFGKIKILANGTGVFVTTKPVDSVIHSFVYTGESKCGTSQSRVYVLDSMYWYLQDTTKVWGSYGNYPNEQMGYYLKETIEYQDFYFVVFTDRRINISKTQYVRALMLASKSPDYITK